MNLQDFINKYNGKGIDFDGAYGNQCMDLMHQWIYEGLGLTDRRTLAAPGAKDVYWNYPNIVGAEYFDQIRNEPTDIPQPGDIVLWGTVVGEFGHVAIFVEGNTNNFTSFDQNWPIDSLCHLQPHTYRGVLGWLRFKGATSPSVPSGGGRTMEPTVLVKDVIKASWEGTDNGIISDSELQNQLSKQPFNLQALLKMLISAAGYRTKGEYENLQNTNNFLQNKLGETQELLKGANEQIQALKDSQSTPGVGEPLPPAQPSNGGTTPTPPVSDNNGSTGGSDNRLLFKRLLDWVKSLIG